MNANLKDEKFIIKDYDKSKCFSSFLPGIAGKNGIPMWVFYVNRGQGIASFGIENKDKAIMEFKPADQSYSATNLKGFRTFLKINSKFYEAFSSTLSSDKIHREMTIERNSMTISELNDELKLETIVSYFILPQEKFASLVRTVEIKNLSQDNVNIEIVDGIPEVLPFGISNNLYKDMGFTARAWMETTNVENRMPFFGVRTAVGDSEIVEEIKSSYFYFASDGEKLLDNIYDRNALFGSDTSLQVPEFFKKNSIEGILNKKQYTENLLPCAFGMTSKVIEANGSLKIHSMIGYSEEKNYLNENIEKFISNNYIYQKKLIAKEVVETLVRDIETKTSNTLFNEYCKQNFLDNMLRGGYPTVYNTAKGKSVYHLYSRKHGDLERDYNFFSLQANKYSQGNGNFRDVLQNRRNDVFFNPEVEEFNIKMFMNFIQADGNNPLVIKGTNFKVEGFLGEILKDVEDTDNLLEGYLETNYFTPGEVLSFIEKNRISLKISEDEFINNLIYHSKQYEQAEFGEGYWIDHWTYLMDLLESFNEIYPDKLDKIMFNDFIYKTYDSISYVKSRKEKYKLHNGKVMQIKAIEESHEKGELIKKRGHNYLVDVNQKIYTTNLFGKLFLLSLTKFTTLDPFGMGLEMEANKPGWNDALNGMPGLLGSSLGETFELKRLFIFIKNSLISTKVEEISIFKELAILCENLEELLDDYFYDKNQFVYWNKVSELKENYRKKVFFNISGKEVTFSKNSLLNLINKILCKIEEGIKNSKKYSEDIYPTYFVYNLKNYEILEGNIVPLEFQCRTLPLFLEGPTRAFKTLDKKNQKELYDYIKKSPIYDKKLKMYKTSESIETESHEIGRLRAFTPGWLENESIFMHMEFKYLLELLKAELYDEFFENIKTAFPPYLSYETYGRSVLENSSFIVSSANRNTELHGQGFSARLSGSTAEFLSMWKYIFAGKTLFTYENNSLKFTFNPRIPNDFFDEKGQLEFKLFSRINVKYINKTGKNSFGENSAKISKMEFELLGDLITIEGNELSHKYALALRNKDITNLICYFE